MQAEPEDLGPGLPSGAAPPESGDLGPGLPSGAAPPGLCLILVRGQVAAAISRNRAA